MTSLVLFDGVCNLCAGIVQWVIPRDPAANIQFAALQSPSGVKICNRYGINANELISMVFVHESIAYQGSDAALMLLGILSTPFRHLTILRIVPRFVRDPIYRWVARNRYLWFGQKETCMLSMPGHSERFLSDR
jgi:predicted DCC family thiol-disulfide oxidoreductase YuxK